MLVQHWPNNIKNYFMQTTRKMFLNILRNILFFFVFSGLAYSQKILEKNEEKNIVTLDSNFEKGTRLEVRIGINKIGLLKSIGENRAKIIYGKEIVDIGARVFIKPDWDSYGRIIVSYLPFAELETNSEYTELTGNSEKSYNSIATLVRVKFDRKRHAYPIFGLAGWRITYLNIPHYSWAIGPGVTLGFGVEILPEVLDMYFSAGFDLLMGGSNTINWARNEGSYNDDIKKNSGKATNNGGVTGDLCIGIDFRLSQKTSITIIATHFGITNVWEDTGEQSKKDGNYYIENEWQEYLVQKNNGKIIEIGLRFNLFD